jgi:hypothetical protein
LLLLILSLMLALLMVGPHLVAVVAARWRLLAVRLPPP